MVLLFNWPEGQTCLNKSFFGIQIINFIYIFPELLIGVFSKILLECLENVRIVQKLTFFKSPITFNSYERLDKLWGIFVLLPLPNKLLVRFCQPFKFFHIVFIIIFKVGMSSLVKDIENYTQTEDLTTLGCEDIFISIYLFRTEIFCKHIWFLITKLWFEIDKVEKVD